MFQVKDYEFVHDVRKIPMYDKIISIVKKEMVRFTVQEFKDKFDYTLTKKQLSEFKQQLGSELREVVKTMNINDLIYMAYTEYRRDVDQVLNEYNDTDLDFPGTYQTLLEFAIIASEEFDKKLDEDPRFW